MTRYPNEDSAYPSLDMVPGRPRKSALIFYSAHKLPTRSSVNDENRSNASMSVASAGVIGGGPLEESALALHDLSVHCADHFKPNGEEFRRFRTRADD